MKAGYVYILASASGTLYVGVTSDLLRRVHQHRQKLIPGFAARYNVSRLVYFERGDDIVAAIAREKEIKGWRRERKLALIRKHNPTMRDLWEEIAGPTPPQSSF
jgi:putative endonuclease